MKVFISHSQKDHKIADKLAGRLLISGMTPLIATQTRKIGEKLNDKVKGLIEESDCFLVILTSSGEKSRWVQQEIGTAKAYGKHVVPIKTRNIKLPAMLDAGIEHYTFTKSSPEEGFNVVIKYLADFAEENGLKLKKTLSDSDLEYFEIIHLPNPVKCPACKKLEIHIFLCKICGEWLCVNCGSTVKTP